MIIWYTRHERPNKDVKFTLSEAPSPSCCNQMHYALFNLQNGMKGYLFDIAHLISLNACPYCRESLHHCSHPPVDEEVTINQPILPGLEGEY
jgi:hypothetical protein